MPVFQDAGEVYQYIGGVFRAAIADPEIGPQTKASGLSMRFDYSGPESVLLIDFTAGTVQTGDDVPPTEPTLTLTMKADDAHKFWLGDLNLVMAMATGKVKAKGPVPEMLKLLPLAKPLFAQYRKTLEESGRQDLLS